MARTTTVIGWLDEVHSVGHQAAIAIRTEHGHRYTALLGFAGEDSVALSAVLDLIGEGTIDKALRASVPLLWHLTGSVVTRIEPHIHSLTPRIRS